MFDRRMFWHYTPARNRDSILEAGFLFPSICNGDKSQRPILFFTPSDCLPVAHHEECGGEWLRFGHSGGGLFPIGRLPFLASRSPASKSLEETLLFALPDTSKHWVASFEPVALGKFAMIEASVDCGITWARIDSPDMGGGFAAQLATANN